MSLIDKLKNGDKKALEILYIKYQKRLFYIAMYFTKDEDSAADLVHDIFLKIYLNRKKLATTVTLEAQIIRIAKSYCIDVVKKNNNTLPLTDFYLPTAEEEIDYELRLKKKNLFYKQVEELPKECKEIFKLHKFEGLSYAEISSYKNISKKTVENQINKAFKELKKGLFSFLFF